ncbi:2300_t:CDS:1, partial [Acaulospora morrowiae]
HVKNHLKDIPHPEEMTENDELYYLFSIHDFNRDGYLDGNELRNAFSDFEEGNSSADDPRTKLEEITEMIDHVLLEDDMNN